MINDDYLKYIDEPGCIEEVTRVTVVDVTDPNVNALT